MINNVKLILISLFMIGSWSFSQEEETIIEEITFEAERTITLPYRLTSNPEIIDTVIALPTFTYPLLTKSMEIAISVEEIEASKIKIIGKLEKLYPGYVKLGLGNYTMPLGEVYFNALRNRNINYGAHLNHLSSFGNLKGYAPSQFDRTTGKVFGDFYFQRNFLETEFNYLNHGYHYYGIENDSISKDSLRNRIGSYKGTVMFSNIPIKDSAKLKYKFNVGYRFSHEFNRDSSKLTHLNARENNINIGTNFKYKHLNNLFALQADVLLNYYKFGETDTSISAIYRKDTRNNIFSLKPTVTSYWFKNKLKGEIGLDVNFDLNADKILKVIPIVSAQYDLLKGILIPYAGIEGDLQQNSFYSLNRINEFMVSSIDIKNTKVFSVYGGIKGSISKAISYNVSIFSTKYSDHALFVNDSIFSDNYKFNVIYDDVSMTGLKGSITYQMKEKLKVDAYTKLTKNIASKEDYAWNLPELTIGMRGSYNLYDKILIKADIRTEGGRKNPAGLLINDPAIEDKFKLGFLTDINIGAEYRYTKRLSVFLNMNNVAHQMYKRWANYPVYGFQIMGGLTFSF